MLVELSTSKNRQRILFVNPIIYDICGTHYRMNPCLAAPLLTAILRKNGHKAWSLDAEALQLNIEDWLKRQEQPDVIGITVTYLNRNGVKRFLKQVKNKWNNTYYIGGGPHATACPKETLALGFDAIVTGEADNIITELVDEHPKGILQQEDITRDLNSLPFPDFNHHIPNPSYYNGNEPFCEHPEGISIWSRGCPSHCLFCSHPVYQLKPVRFMSPNRIYAEIKNLKDNFGIKHVFVYSDELIGMSKKQNNWIVDVCKEVAPLKLTYKTQGRCSKYSTLETFEAMYDAGFKWVFWGIESLSQKVLTALKKGTKIDDIWRTLRLARKAKINNLGFFMVGCLEEETEDYNETYKGVTEMLKEGLLQRKQVTIMTAEPGSRLYDIAKDKGWLRKLKGRAHYTPHLAMPWASRKEIAERQRALSNL